MARQGRKTSVGVPKTLRTCGECGWGIWDMSHINRDLKGEPICVVCKFEERRKRIRTETACENWKPREEK